MIKLCKIITLAAIAAAVCSVVLVSVLILKGTSGKLDILAEPGVAELFKKSSVVSSGTADTDSLLSKEARLFAFGLDPPPPPKPIVKPGVTQAKTAKTPPVTPVTGPKIQPISKFKLVATVCYPDHPEKSLALLDMTSLGLKWHRSGDKVNHQTIHEIKTESVVLYANDKLSEEISILKPKSKVRSLLRSDSVASVAPTSTTIAASTDQAIPSSAGPGETTGRPEYNARPNLPTRSMVNPSATPTQDRPGISGATMPGIRPPSTTTTGASTYRRRTITPPPPPPSPEDRKKVLNNNISDIQRRIKNIPSDVSVEEKNLETEAWGKLLKLLEKEQTELDIASESAQKADSGAEDAEKSDSSTDNTEK